jgi:site-specific DNA-cytosine methylase
MKKYVIRFVGRSNPNALWENVKRIVEAENRERARYHIEDMGYEECKDGWEKGVTIEEVN